MEVRFQIGGKLVVVMSDSSVCRKIQRVWRIVSGHEADRLKIQHRRDQHDAAQINAEAIVQMLSQGRRAGGAVALAGEIFRTEPAIVLCAI